ncbi:transcriptional regulator [Sorangium cellulosum]|uniref:Transcriptional regulator n=1 Tax=Sorangium cellulosum TaxID=56 RepID=A0A2L0EY93_SORCE|nr:methanogen output domain 1-containing protein [Sorangium cellulosum]AUX44277.1 transcriptional regulator [Sorangium cellulosum]
MSNTAESIRRLPVALDRDVFLRQLLRELAGTLQEVVGLESAAGFVSVVGQKIGDKLNEDYRAAFQAGQLTREQVAATLVDLKRRIQGDFYVIEESDEKLVLGNRACPFGDMVKDRPALCMMTSNVFGLITAENLGYARVVIEESIARGHAGCRVVVYLNPSPETPEPAGQEYFRA